MPAPILVTDAVTVSEAAISVTTARASGPGGQNVNKVASKVDVRVDLAAVTGLDDGARARLRLIVARRLDATGMLGDSKREGLCGAYFATLRIMPSS